MTASSVAAPSDGFVVSGIIGPVVHAETAYDLHATTGTRSSGSGVLGHHHEENR